MDGAGQPASQHEDMVGVDIGDGLITAARVRRDRKGRLAVTHAGWEEYPADASDRDIAQAVKRLWYRTRFRVFTVCSCLRSQSLVLKPFRYSNLAEADLASALKLEA
jgi:hypothetical protein